MCQSHGGPTNVNTRNLINRDDEEIIPLPKMVENRSKNAKDNQPSDFPRYRSTIPISPLD